MRGADLSDIRPEPDTGQRARTAILPNKDIRPHPTAAGQTDLKRTETAAANDAAIDRSPVHAAGRDAFSNTDNPDTRGQTIADGMLTVIGRKYRNDAAVEHDVTDSAHGAIPMTNALGTFDHGDDANTAEIPLVNRSEYRTHTIDLAAAVDGGQVGQRREARRYCQDDDRKAAEDLGV